MYRHHLSGDSDDARVCVLEHIDKHLLLRLRWNEGERHRQQ
jgi:hypothetical protein